MRTLRRLFLLKVIPYDRWGWSATSGAQSDLEGAFGHQPPCHDGAQFTLRLLREPVVGMKMPGGSRKLERQEMRRIDAILKAD